MLVYSMQMFITFMIRMISSMLNKPEKKELLKYE